MTLTKQQEEARVLALQENKLELYYINVDILTFRFSRKAQDKINAMIGLATKAKDEENRNLGITMIHETFKGLPKSFFARIEISSNYLRYYTHPFRNIMIGKDYIITKRIYSLLERDLDRTGEFVNMRKQLARKDAIKQKLIKINKFLSN